MLARHPHESVDMKPTPVTDGTGNTYIYCFKFCGILKWSYVTYRAINVSAAVVNALFCFSDLKKFPVHINGT